MSISITDAITKWCPMVRLDGNVTAYNRIERQPVPVGAMCLGPKCMMWHSESDTHGDCGLKQRATLNVSQEQMKEMWETAQDAHAKRLSSQQMKMEEAKSAMETAQRKAHPHPTPASGVKKDGPAV